MSRKIYPLLIGTLTIAFVAMGGYALGAQKGSQPQNTPMMQNRMMGRGMMMNQTMGMGMGQHMISMMCPQMTMDPDVTVSVKNLKNGASIEVTSSDKDTAVRIQKKAQLMEQMRELMTEEGSS